MPPPPAIATSVAVLFDMDGVILDSEPTAERVMKQAARAFGFDVPDAAIPSFKGLPGQVVYERIARDYGAGRVDGPALRSVRDRMYEDVLSDIPLMPGVREVLELLAKRACPSALVTSSRRRHAETILDVHGLQPLFRVVIGSEDITHPKPAPDPFLAAAKALDVDAHRCLVVEDSVNGVRSGAAAGCLVAGFGVDFDGQDLLEAGASILCPDHAALRLLLQPS